MAEQLYNFVSGAVAAPGCASGDAVITLDDASEFPTVGDFRCTIEQEIVLVSSVVGNDLHVSRGVESSVAAAHSGGVSVSLVLTAGAIIQYVSEH
jgi:hypothetical protein